jgi:hypothetical protein
MITLHATTGIKNVKNNTTKLDLKLSTIFKEKINNIPQAYGSLFNRNGEYCALGAIVKYLGYDMALEAQSAAAAASLSSLTDGTDSIKNHRDKYNNNDKDDNNNNKTTTGTSSPPPLYSSSSSSPFESIPLNILERIERFSHYNNSNSISKHPSCCDRVLENHYDYSLISLLIHLNDYHHMSFAEIGNWLEFKGL